MRCNPLNHTKSIIYAFVDLNSLNTVITANAESVVRSPRKIQFIQKRATGYATKARISVNCNTATKIALALYVHHTIVQAVSKYPRTPLPVSLVISRYCTLEKE